MTANGTFLVHVENVVSTPKIKCTGIIRSFRTRSLLPMMILYKSLIPSVHGYCVQIWNPSQKINILALEAVLRSFTS